MLGRDCWMRSWVAPRYAVVSVAALVLVAWLLGPVALAALPAPPGLHSSGYVEAPTGESAIDEDGDGQVDAVLLTVPFVLNVSGRWWFRAYVETDAFSAGNFTERTLETGRHEEAFWLDGWRIRIGREDGPYRVNLSMYHTDSAFFASRTYESAAYAWDSFELRAELTGSYSAQGLDVDGDGFYNYLDVEGAVNVGWSEELGITGSLFEPSTGRQISNAGVYREFPIGVTAFHVRFDGDAIRSFGVDGPWDVTISLSTTGETAEFLGTDTFRSPSLAAASFFHEPFSFGETPTDEGLDFDGNGRYEVLRILVPLHVSIPGRYYLWGWIHGTQGHVGGFPYAFADVDLPAGVAWVALDFEGFDVRQTLVNGPFAAELWASEPGTSYQRTSSYTTKSYYFDAFDNPFGYLAAAPEIWPVDLDGDPEFEELRVNVTIHVRNATTFVVDIYMGVPQLLHHRREVAAEPGTAVVQEVFPAWRLHATGIDGTYDFAVALSAEGVYLDGRRASRNFRSEDFEPALRLRSPPETVPIDNDGDGRINVVEVRLPLRIEVEGSYSFIGIISSGLASARAHRFRWLSPGDVDIVLRFSGLDLRGFPAGDAERSIRVMMTTPSTILVYGAVTVLDLRDPYPIDDPSTFQSFPTGNVTIRFRTDLAGSVDAYGFMLNYSNEYRVAWYIRGGSVDLTIPEIGYAGVAILTQPGTVGSRGGTFELSSPFPTEVEVAVEPVEIARDHVRLEFDPWFNGHGWANVTVDGRTGIRFSADSVYDPDGFASEAELWNLFEVPLSGRLPPVSVDGRPIAPSRSGSGVIEGAGSVLSTAPVVASLPFAFEGSGELASSHTIGATLVRYGSSQSASNNVTVVLAFPPGWTVTSVEAGPELRVTTSPSEVEIEAIKEGFGTWQANITVALSAAPSGEIAGIVGRSDETPIAGASVVLRRGGSEIGDAVTPDDGSFSFPGLPSGTYELAVSAIGYVSRVVTIAMQDHQKLSLVVTLEAVPPSPGSIRGRVVDPAGDPIADASATLLPASGSPHASSTAQDGTFSLGELPAGSYVLRVEAGGFQSREMPVELAAGEEEDLGDIVLDPVPAGVGPLGGLDPLLFGLSAGVAGAFVVAVLVAIRARRKKA